MENNKNDHIKTKTWRSSALSSVTIVCCFYILVIPMCLNIWDNYKRTALMLPKPRLGSNSSAKQKPFEANCSIEAYLTVNDGGRLGNQMSQYATLFAHAKRLGLKPFISDKMKSNLKLFRLLNRFLHFQLCVTDISLTSKKWSDMHALKKSC